MKFLIFSEYGELLDLAIHLKYLEKQEVVLHIPNHDYEIIGEGIVEKVKEWWRCIGKEYVWVFDGCERGDLQDWLREKGEFVVNGTGKTDKLENDRQLGQKWFKAAGFYQPVSKNFKDFDSAIEFVKQSKFKLILKQNGSAPKHLSHKGEFDGGIDMLYHLENLKKSWNESEFGAVDFDLMEVMDGLEVAASAFFNGREFLKNRAGKIVGFLNFEEKKEANGQTGETTGETGTTFMGVTEDNPIFKDILLRPKILEVLRATKFKGVFDINGMKTDKGYVAFEPTCRFGIPSTSYEFMEGLKTPTWELLSSLARGENKPVEVKMGTGMVIVVTAKPFPVEASLEKESTSLGEKLWILENGKPKNELSTEQLKHIHLQNFEKRGNDYLVATKHGYLLTCTATGKNISDTRNKLIDYIKNNLYISGLKIRTDIGARVEEKL